MFRRSRSSCYLKAFLAGLVYRQCVFVPQASTTPRQGGSEGGFESPYGRGQSMLEPDYGDYDDEMAVNMGHQRFGKRRRTDRGPMHKSNAICSYFMQGKCQKVGLGKFCGFSVTYLTICVGFI